MKTTFKLIAIIAIIITPIIIIYQTAKLNTRYSNKILLLQLKHKITNLKKTVINNVDIKTLIANDLKGNAFILRNFMPHNKIQDKVFWKKCNKLINKMLQKYNLPIQIGILFKRNGNFFYKTYGTNFNLQKVITCIAKITNVKDLLINSNNEKQQQFNLSLLNKKIRKILGTSLDYVQVKKYISMAYTTIAREAKSVKICTALKDIHSLLLFAVTDITGIKIDFYLRLKANSFNSRNNCGVAFLNTKNQTFISSDFFNKKNKLINFLKLNRKISNKNFTGYIEFNRFLIYTDSFPYSYYKYIIVLKYPQKSIKLPISIQFLLTFLSLLACIIFKLFIDKTIFKKGKDISIRNMVFYAFLTIVIIPLSVSYYLQKQYALISFIKLYNNTSQILASKIDNLDRQILRENRNRINRMKSFNSLPKIKKYINEKQNLPISKMIYKFSYKFTNHYNNLYCTSFFTYDKKNKLHYFVYHGQGINCRLSKEKPLPLFSDILLHRFQQILNIKTEKLNKIDTDKIKIELMNDTIKTLFGKNSLYKINDIYNNTLDLVSNYYTNSIITIPLKGYNTDKNTSILCWMRDTKSSVPNLKKYLSLNNPSNILFTVQGSEKPYNTQPMYSEYISNKFPKLMNLATLAHKLKTKIQTEIKINNLQLTAMGKPSKNLPLSIIGTAKLPNLQEKEKAIKIEAAKKILIFVLSVIILAFISSWYFLNPIKSLARAIEKITAKDYSVRLNIKQPDEFKQIFKSFNKLAKDLENGTLLKKFVAKSVEEEINKADKISNKAQLKEVTVLFSCISNFKQMQKEKDINEIFATLQAHLQTAVNIIEKTKGEIDKIIEDKLMIVFEGRNHKQDAIQTAQIIKNNLQNKGIYTSMGINSGLVVSAIMGAKDVRLSKTIVGDAVNLAARLASIAETSNKNCIVISENTLKNTNLTLKIQKLNIDKVKGKTQTIRAYLLN